MNIPEQAIEAAAKALCDNEGYAQPQSWNYEDARIALTAALPLVGVQRPEDVARPTLSAAPASPQRAGFICGNCSEPVDPVWKHCAWCGSTPDWLPAPPVIAETGPEAGELSDPFQHQKS